MSGKKVNDIKKKRRKKGIKTPTNVLIQKTTQEETNEEIQEDTNVSENVVLHEQTEEGAEERSEEENNVIHKAEEEHAETPELHANHELSLNERIIQEIFKLKIDDTKVEILEEIKEEINEGVLEDMKEEKKNGTEVERIRVSFDLNKNYHKQLKLQSLLQERNIYLLIEDALKDYFDKLERK